MGALVVVRGELWWLETPDEKGRPVLVISRDEANARITENTTRFEAERKALTDEHAGQLLNLGVGVGVPERRCSPGDFLLQRNAAGRRVSRDGQENVRGSNAGSTVLV